MNLQTRSMGTITTHTVIGEITGSSMPDEAVLMGCHLDSWDLGTGAVDDGAGCAIVLVAGAMIGRLETAPARSVRAVLFGAEELGLVGARAYVIYAVIAANWSGNLRFVKRRVTILTRVRNILHRCITRSPTR